MMVITACPKCGSKKIEMGTMNAGVTFGVTSWKSVCRDCGYQGEPLLFESEEEYNNFLQGFTPEQESTSGLAPEDDCSELSKKDKDVIDLLKEDINEIEPGAENTSEQGVFPINKSWWIEIFFAMILALLNVSFYLFTLYGSLDTVVLIAYGLVLFIVLTAGALITIAIIEYIYFSIRKTQHRKK